jgi:isocitrate lyase
MSTVGNRSPQQIQHDWDHNPRWKGITRTYTPGRRRPAGHVVEETRWLAAAPRCSGSSSTMDYVNSAR